MTSGKKAQFLEHKINNLRWANDSLNKQVFAAVQRGNRLANKLGYQDLDEAEAAFATQLADPAAQESQREELATQHPPEELASHVQALQAELLGHVKLSKETLGALGDALSEITALSEENEGLREALKEEKQRVAGSKEKGEGKCGDGVAAPSGDFDELAFKREELATLQEKYADLRKAKEDADRKHNQDYQRWKEFKHWLFEGISERATKRRKLNTDSDVKNHAAAWRAQINHAKKKFDGCDSETKASALTLPTSPMHTPTKPASPSLTSTRASSATVVASSSGACTAGPSRKASMLKVERTPSLPKVDIPASSDTEPDSQPVTFLYPSQIDVSAIPSRAPNFCVLKQDSSETDFEAEQTTFLLPSQIEPLTPAQMAEMTPRPYANLRRLVAQPMTPLSLPRPPLAAKGKATAQNSATTSSPLGARPDPFNVACSPGKVEVSKEHTPKRGVPQSSLPKKRKRTDENDENAKPSTTPSPGEASKKRLEDYSAYKGRGRYKVETVAEKQTINAQFEINPEHNGGLAYQFDEVVRDKERRKKLHANDCECCRDYYEALEPLPPLPQPPLWRSPPTSPTKPGGSSTRKKNEVEAHKQAISRHRAQWQRGPTPPGYWDIGFPDTQRVAALNAEADRMHARKRALVEEEAERGGRYKKR